MIYERYFYGVLGFWAYGEIVRESLAKLIEQFPLIVVSMGARE